MESPRYSESEETSAKAFSQERQKLRRGDEKNQSTNHNLPSNDIPPDSSEENMDIITKFTNFLRTSFLQNSSQNCNLNDTNRSQDRGNSPFIRHETYNRSSISDCKSFSYRNDSTAFVSSCEDHRGRCNFSTEDNCFNIERNPVGRICDLNHQCHHSTPKEIKQKTRDIPKVPCSEHQACIHSELCRYPEQSPISSPNNKNVEQCSCVSVLLEVGKGFNSDHKRKEDKAVMTGNSENKGIMCNRFSENSVSEPTECLNGEIGLRGEKILGTRIASSKDAFTDVQSDLMELREQSTHRDNDFTENKQIPGETSTIYTKADDQIRQPKSINRNNTYGGKWSDKLQPHNNDLIQVIETSTQVNENFVKPTILPLRRRIRHTPSVGGSCVSGKSIRRTIQKMDEKMVYSKIEPHKTPPSGYSCRSPALSEFDLKLIQKAKSGNSSKVHVDKPMNEVTQPISPCLSSTITNSFSTESDDDFSYDNIGDSVSESSKEETCYSERVNGKQKSGCPGCCMPDVTTVLNSRTFNIVLESSSKTCAVHRHVRKLERKFIKNRKLISEGNADQLKIAKICSKSVNQDDVYDFQSPNGKGNQENVSPPDESEDDKIPVWRLKLRRNQERRKRIDYSQEEVDNLVDGVKTMGRKWNQILLTYKFHPSRTSVDLKDKYKRLMKSGSGGRRPKVPFSMCEERRLKRGIKIYGYNWKGILNNYNFASERTAEDLRYKWRNMNRKQREWEQ